MYLNLETERLRIRPIELSDAAFIFDLVNTEGWLTYIGDRNIFDTDAAEKYIQKIRDTPKYHYHVFELKDSGQAIGVVTFLHREDQQYPDIGFAMLPAFERKGYAHEAARAYLREILKSGHYKNIIAITLPENLASIGLLVKLGLSYQYAISREHQTLSLFSLTPLPIEVGKTTP